MFHVEPRLAKELLGIGHAQTVAVFRNAHSDVFVKESRKMPVAGACDARKRPQTPRFAQIGGDDILHAMYRRMNMIATFQPGGELWVRPVAAQVDDEITRDCQGAGLVCESMNEVQHKVDACCNAGA